MRLQNKINRRTNVQSSVDAGSGRTSYWHITISEICEFFCVSVFLQLLAVVVAHQSPFFLVVDFVFLPRIFSETTFPLFERVGCESRFSLISGANFIPTAATFVSSNSTFGPQISALSPQRLAHVCQRRNQVVLGGC